MSSFVGPIKELALGIYDGPHATPPEAESGPVFLRSNVGGSQVRVVAQYPASKILASGWLRGEEYIASRAAVVDVEFGRGHFVLFGVRPQYRGQSNAAFKMVFNSLFYW